MLQSVQPKRCQGRGIAAIPHAKHPAFLMRLVILKSHGQRHG
jgi:hypothetical protein